MTEEKTTTVEMTAEELQELQELRALKAQKAAEEQKKADRQTYEQMVDEQVRNTVATAHSCSDVMRDCKTAIYDGFTGFSSPEDPRILPWSCFLFEPRLVSGLAARRAGNRPFPPVRHATICRHTPQPMGRMRRQPCFSSAPSFFINVTLIAVPSPGSLFKSIFAP